MTVLTFDTYKPEYAEAFKRLNLAWLEEFFYVERHDDEVLSKPKEYIIDPGGHVLVAKRNDNVVAVVALMKVGDSVFELTKMAVDTKYRGQQMGQQLMAYCMAFVKEKKIDHLILYSNRILVNALHIYRKFGFREVPLEKDNPYDRADIKMKLRV